VEHFRDRLKLPPDKFVIVPNGAQLPDSTFAHQTRSDGELIVSVGRLERYKGHHRVIAALPSVLAHRPDARLRIVGSGPYEPVLLQLARDLEVHERVEIGAISGSDRQGMASLLSEAALVTLLSDYESQGIAVMEALKFKRPVLVTDTSALREMAERGLVRSVSLQSGPQQVAQAILEQLDRPLIPPDVHIPSWDDCAEQLLSVYEDVIGST
jgi:glycosyltransferase involved in cell wall biosynthesis